MHKIPVSLGLALTLLAGTAGAATTQAPSLLAPITPRIKAVVRQAQPRASFGAFRDILIGQYRTTNYVIQLRGPDGRKQPAFQELGPLHGGFYLQLEVRRGVRGTAAHVTPPNSQSPWTTVTSFYRLPGGRAIVMTWEAAPGAPRGVAAKVGHILSSYAASLG